MTQPQAARPPTREGVLRAAEKIGAILPPTPLLPLTIDGVQCWAKAECLQPIGAFKIRGAWHRISDLPEQDRARGVIGVSSGNHAQGVAWAARRLGIDATIVMPSDAPRIKRANVEAMGARVVEYERNIGDRDAIARDLQAESGATIVHAFADPWVIEGQGSAGIEVVAQLAERRAPALTRLIVPCGGGGLSAGLALACPDVRIVPVEPVGWDTVGRSLASGQAQRAGPEAPKTICDCLQAPAAQDINLAVLRGRTEACLTVSDAEIRRAMRYAFAQLRLVVEPGACAGLAAVLAGKAAVDEGTVIMLTGGNVDPALFAGVLAEGD